MQRSSSSIANLAAALAKAQIALVNPEKSLVATIRQGGASGTEQTFRYRFKQADVKAQARQAIRRKPRKLTASVRGISRRLLNAHQFAFCG